MGRVAAAIAGLAILWSAFSHSGEPPQRVRRSAFEPANLRQITETAGMIFLGRVEGIESVSSGDRRVSRVRVTFKVLDGIRGARSGESIHIEEWAGLWAAGHEHYQAGQTVMLFLYPQSRLGLTSPVGGDAGRLEITPTRRVVLVPDRTETLLPRSLRLQKQQAALDEIRLERTPHYTQFAQVVRELAGEPQ